jgi:hypothetical protein
MSLTDIQIKDLAKRMKVPLVFCGFKTELEGKKLQYGKSYIVNIEDEYDDKGERNDGTHYTCFQVNKYPSGKVERIYFDSFGQPPPQIVEKFCGGKLPYQTKDIQSLMNEACGWYCLAFLHYINAFEGRTKDLYTDCEHFTDLFDDLNKSADHLKNEYVLKHFFQSEDPKKRTPVELKGMGGVADPDTIDGDDEDKNKGGMVHIPVEVKYV